MTNADAAKPEAKPRSVLVALASDILRRGRPDTIAELTIALKADARRLGIHYGAYELHDAINVILCRWDRRPQAGGRGAK